MEPRSFSFTGLRPLGTLGSASTTTIIPELRASGRKEFRRGASSQRANLSNSFSNSKRGGFQRTDSGSSRTVFRTLSNSSSFKGSKLLEDMKWSGADIQEVREAAALKIQNLARRFLGKLFVFRETLKGGLVSVPPDRRLIIRSKVQERFRSELPSYTFETWRFEAPWNPFVAGAKFPLHHHKIERDSGNAHVFVRLGEKFENFDVPGTEFGHEALDSHRIWVSKVYKQQAGAVLEQTMKQAWPLQTH